MTASTLTSSTGFKQQVGRLAQYRPFGHTGELTVELVRRQLVSAAAFETGPGFGALDEIQAACARLWGLDLEMDELRSVVGSLERAGKLTKAAGSLVLTDAARAELGAVVESSERTETKALAEWEARARIVASELSPEDISLLGEDLLEWLQRIIVHYGAEAALILYPEEERAHRFFDEVQELGFDFLPKRDAALMVARPTLLYLFIRNPTQAQRGFIANLMTTAYMAAVFTLDPSAQRLVQEVTRGQRVYLDTNVLYSVLNLNGPRAYLSVKRVLDMTRDLDVGLAVTPWTITEMKESVRHCRDELARTSLPPRALADIAADTAGEGSFITAYWRKYKETGVTPKDFCDLHEQIEGLIEKLGIVICDDGCFEIERRFDPISEQMSLIDHVRGSDSKSDRVKEHDVRHRLLVEKLRGSNDRRFSDAGYWFLTRDGGLIPYGLAGRAPNALPFAVSLTAWAQIVRGLTARTDDFDKTLVDLLDTPSLRPRGVINPQTIAEVLGRIDLLVSDSTEAVAARVMLDSAAMVEIEAESGAARDTRIEAIVAEKNRDMERQLAEAERQLEAERNTRAKIEAQVATTSQDAASEHSRLESEREQVERALAELSGQAERERSDAKDRIAAADARARTAEKKSQENAERLERSVRLARLAGAAACAVLGIAVVAVPLGTGWATGGWSLVGLIVLGGLLVALGVAAGVHRHAAKRLLVVAVAVISAAAGIYEIVSASSHKEKPRGAQQVGSRGRR
jgi:hypothetical protein